MANVYTEIAKKRSEQSKQPAPLSPFEEVADALKQQLDAKPKTNKAKPSHINTSKRALLRRTFDFYEDQVTYLTRLSLEKKLAGEDESMNAMIREAVDNYIAKRKNVK